MAIKLLLINEVEDLGLSGDIVAVKPGYARNFLLPQGLAVIADNNAIRRQEKLLQERKKKEALNRKESEVFAKSLEEITITTTVKVDPEGHMYGSVSVLDIIHLLKEQHDIEIPKRFVLLKHPIKSIGVTSIPLKLIGDVDASFNIKIVEEKEEAKAEEKEEIKTEENSEVVPEKVEEE